jgi:hypothetical protein
MITRYKTLYKHSKVTQDIVVTIGAPRVVPRRRATRPGGSARIGTGTDINR